MPQFFLAGWIEIGVVLPASTQPKDYVIRFKTLLQMKININSYLPSSKLVAMAVRFPKCDGTIWDTLLNWFPRLLQDCRPLVFRHVLNLKVQEFLASHQKISWRNIWLGRFQISPLPEVQWAVKRRVKGCKHSQVDEKNPSKWTLDVPHFGHNSKYTHQKGVFVIGFFWK